MGAFLLFSPLSFSAPQNQSSSWLSSKSSSWLCFLDCSTDCSSCQWCLVLLAPTPISTWNQSRQLGVLGIRPAPLRRAARLRQEASHLFTQWTFSHLVHLVHWRTREDLTIKSWKLKAAKIQKNKTEKQDASLLHFDVCFQTCCEHEIQIWRIKTLNGIKYCQFFSFRPGKSYNWIASDRNICALLIIGGGEDWFQITTDNTSLLMPVLSERIRLDHVTKMVKLELSVGSTFVHIFYCKKE